MLATVKTLLLLYTISPKTSQSPNLSLAISSRTRRRNISCTALFRNHHQQQLVEAFHYNKSLKSFIGELSSADDAVGILDRYGDWSSAMLWIVVRYLIQTNRGQEAVQVFDVWKNKECSRVNSANYSKIIRLLVEGFLMDEAAATFEEMEKCGLTLSLGVYNDIIHGFAWEKEFDKSGSVLKKMLDAGVPPTTETFNGLIQAYGYHKMYDQMSKCVKTMGSEGCLANEVTYNILIGEFAQGRLLERMEVAYRTLLSKKMNLHVPTMLAMLEAYADLGIVEKMEKVYRKILNAKGFLKEGLIRRLAVVYIENYRYVRLEELGNEIASISGRTDLVWCIFLLSSALLSSRKGIESIVRQMDITQVQVNVTFTNILGLFYAKMKEFKALDALLVQNAKKKVKPDLMTFGILFDACQTGFDGIRVLETWRRHGYLEEQVEIRTDPLYQAAFGKGLFMKRCEKVYLSLGPSAKEKQTWTYSNLIQLVFGRGTKNRSNYYNQT